LLTPGASARGVLSEIRRQLIRCALTRHRDDITKLFALRTAERVKHARQVTKAIEVLRVATVATPSITDEIERWLVPRAVHALRAHGIKTLAELTLRIPRESNGGRRSLSLDKAALNKSRRFLLLTRHSLNALAH
jgi:Phage integrase protein